jgi:ornithine cyclodeaminase
MLAIGRADLRRSVTIRDAIDAARIAFVALSGGQATVPSRPHLATAHGATLVMPAYATDLGTVGVKIVTVTPNNTRADLPTVQGIVVLVDEETGTPVALLEGTYLTQLRTGAAIGFAADLLARGDAHNVAVFGAGAMAQSSLAAVCAVRDIRNVRVIDPHRDRFERFTVTVQEIMGESCPSLDWVSSPIDALAGTDIVITATTSPNPVFPGDALQPGTFVGALGAYTPTTRELDTLTIQRSRFFVDTKGGALHEAGEIVIPIERGEIAEDHIQAEIGEVALGERAGRLTPDDITVFKTVGNAMQDLVLAARVYARALELGLGRRVDLS